ncbi:hypothetical protein M0802_016107 [Mischocyttarus mexicanus]|nr:hypothetical protein M0802_016107 [Mischocyttarus mexicanus]
MSNFWPQFNGKKSDILLFFPHQFDISKVGNRSRITFADFLRVPVGRATEEEEEEEEEKDDEEDEEEEEEEERE